MRLQEQPSDYDLEQDTKGLLKQPRDQDPRPGPNLLIRHSFLSQSRLEGRGCFRKLFPLGSEQALPMRNSETAGSSHHLSGPPF